MPTSAAEIEQLQALIGQGLTSLQIAAAMGRSRPWVLQHASRHQITWVSRVGSPRKSLNRPLPKDFAERGPTLSIAETMTHYACGASTVYRWRREAGVAGKCQPKVREPIPSRVQADVLVRFPGANAATICAALGVCRSTLRKRMIALGLRFPEPQHTATTPRKAPADARASRARQSPTVSRMGGGSGPSMLVEQFNRDMSDAGQAADYLRRLGPVYRSTEGGAADPAGPMWRFGNAILTPDDLIARAMRKGWQPVRWAA